MMELLTKLAVLELNMGIVMGLTFGTLILLRPVTGRLLRPQHQVCLWYMGWLVGIMSVTYDTLGRRLRPFPVTFRSLVVPRVEKRSIDSAYPAFFWNQAGEEAPLVLPGGTQVEIPHYEQLLGVLTILWLAVVVGAFIWYSLQGRKLRRLSEQGERMDRETMALYGLTDSRVAVRLCENLPTSFVRMGHDTGRRDGVSYVICLQKELPPEQMELVLRHELAHIHLRHPGYKGCMLLALIGFFWWNPILWLAFRLTCRDMELACDEAVMETLEPEERREYARTLVELGAGKYLWGSVTSFGECDAALRVRRVTGWKPAGETARALSVLLAAGLFLFFFCGGPVYKSWDGSAGSAEWSEYLESGAWVDRVAEQLEQPDWQPREVWSRQAERLVVLDEEGEWYALSFEGWWEKEYRWINITPMKQAFLNGYTQVG